MSTITPTTNSSQTINCNVFVKGDFVSSIDTGLAGQILETNFGGIAAQVYVRWGNETMSAVQVSRLRRA